MAEDPTPPSGDLLEGEDSEQATKENSEQAALEKELRLQTIASWSAAILIFVVAVILTVYMLILSFREKVLVVYLEEQFPALLGLPAVAGMSLFIVLVLRISTGPIKIEYGKLKFEGAAAPIVFWIVCFLVMATMLKILWLPEP